MKTLRQSSVALACFSMLIGLAGCASPSATQQAQSASVAASLDFPMPPVTNIMQPGMAPTPYTADQIREANPPGSWKLYQIVADGRRLQQRFEFVENANPDLAALAVTMTDDSGVKIDANRPAPATWTSLQSHGSYEAHKTLLGRDRISIEAGEFDCWTYAVDGREGDLSFFWFATNMPGPPVLMEKRVDGKATLRMELKDFGSK